METVHPRFKISATTFHTTSTSPMLRYSPFPLGISTTACHMISSTRRPSPKFAFTRSTTFYQCVISSISISLFSSFSSPPGPQTDATAHSTTSAFVAATPSFRASSIHPLRWSILIPEGPPERWFLSRLIVQVISSYIGTKSSTWNGSIYTWMFSPLGWYVVV